MMKLVLLRHGESEWNKENLFTGWTDVDLSETGRTEAHNAAKLLMDAGLDFDVCHTSYLKRAIHTLNIVLEDMDRQWLPVVKTWKLNERHYGALQGMNKADTAAKYGEEQVHIWRRSFDIRPPELTSDDGRNPALQAQYRRVDKDELPLCESLKDTSARVLPYFDDEILAGMRRGERILIAAHGNSLRALIKRFDALSGEEIARINIPTGIPLVYTFDRDMRVLDKRYLGDPEAVEKKIAGVANQGKAN
jgi:2,3-bisphosphoglycerate-dependent phosphoglycerate mutase